MTIVSDTRHVHVFTFNTDLKMNTNIGLLVGRGQMDISGRVVLWVLFIWVEWVLDT